MDVLLVHADECCSVIPILSMFHTLTAGFWTGIGAGCVPSTMTSRWGLILLLANGNKWGEEGEEKRDSLIPCISLSLASTRTTHTPFSHLSLFASCFCFPCLQGTAAITLAALLGAVRAVDRADPFAQGPRKPAAAHPTSPDPNAAAPEGDSDAHGGDDSSLPLPHAGARRMPSGPVASVEAASGRGKEASGEMKQHRVLFFGAGGCSAPYPSHTHMTANQDTHQSIGPLPLAMPAPLTLSRSRPSAPPDLSCRTQPVPHPCLAWQGRPAWVLRPS